MFCKDVRLQNLMKLRFSLQESIQKLLFLKFYLNLLKLFLIEHYLSLFLIKRIWPRFNEPWLCRSHIYIITIVKLVKRLFNIIFMLVRELVWILANCVVRMVFGLAFFKLIKNEESFGVSFTLPFSRQCVNRNFKYLF